jgi:hypothetical protein
MKYEKRSKFILKNLILSSFILAILSIISLLESSLWPLVSLIALLPTQSMMICWILSEEKVENKEKYALFAILSDVVVFACFWFLGSKGSNWQGATLVFMFIGLIIPDYVKFKML